MSSRSVPRFVVPLAIAGLLVVASLSVVGSGALAAPTNRIPSDQARTALTSSGTVQLVTTSNPDSQGAGVLFVDPSTGRVAGNSTSGALRTAVTDYISFARANAKAGVAAGGDSDSRITFRRELTVDEFNVLAKSHNLTVREASLRKRYSNGQNGGMIAPGTSAGLDSARISGRSATSTGRSGDNPGTVTYVGVMDATVRLASSSYDALAADSRVLVIDTSQSAMRSRLATAGITREASTIFLPPLADAVRELGLERF